MKPNKILSVLLAAVMLLGLMPAFTVSFAADVDDLTFALSEDEASYYISACDTSAAGTLVIPDTYAGKPVISIGNNAFMDCASLSAITIPDSVTSIGDNAFDSCKKLKSITIPDSVTSIGDTAFVACTKLENVIIPDSVTSIGDYMFSGCLSLTSVTISDSVASISEGLFWECENLPAVIIPDSVTSINNYAFRDCINLKSVIIPDSVTSIGISAFSDCFSLPAITIPDSVTSIGASAFGFCEKLTSIIIPNSVTSIASGTFEGCLRLENITIPNSVTSIGEDAFRDCASLSDVTIPNSVTSIGERAFINCTDLENVAILGSSVSIGSTAFEACNAVLHCFDNSTVKTYAIENSHTYHLLPTEGVVVLAANCTEEGIVRYICPNCTCTAESSTPIDSTNHVFSSLWSIDTPATCSSTGVKSHHCTHCDAIGSVTEIQMLPHSFGTEYKGDAENHWFECDCGETSAPEAHTAGEWTLKSEASFLNNSIEGSTCTVCGMELEREIEGTAQSAITFAQSPIMQGLLTVFMSIVSAISAFRSLYNK